MRLTISPSFKGESRDQDGRKSGETRKLKERLFSHYQA
jgi:hypothetical protein